MASSNNVTQKGKQTTTRAHSNVATTRSTSLYIGNMIVLGFLRFNVSNAVTSLTLTLRFSSKFVKKKQEQQQDHGQMLLHLNRQLVTLAT